MRAAREAGWVSLPSNNETHDRALEGMNWATQLSLSIRYGWINLQCRCYRAMLQREIDVKHLARGMTLPGFRHQHQDFIGSIAAITRGQRDHWLKTMHDTGLRAA